MPQSFHRPRHLLTPLAVMLLSSATLLLPLAPLQAQPAATAVPASDVVSAARRIIAARYVLPDTAAKLDAALAAATAKGEFKGLSGEGLAQRINQVIRTVTADGHMSVRYAPPMPGAAGPGPGPRLVLAPRPGGPAQGPGPQPGTPGLPPEMAREIVLANGGVHKLELLPGNVRYLDYRGFMSGTPDAEAALAGAMAFLRGGDAIIIDLRRNGGGAVEAVAAMAGYFLKEGTPLMRFERRGEPGESSTAARAPFSLAGKPVYVLAGKGSFSAAEEFAAHVDAFGFAKLVGTATGGGSFNNELEPLPGGFVLSVSVGRAVHALTGKDWEGTGIKPAIQTSEETALDVALAEALQAVLAKTRPQERPSLERFSAFYTAKREARTANRPLASYAGQFGPLTFTVVGDRLMAASPGRPTAVLQALGPDRFANGNNPVQQWQFEFTDDTASAVSVSDPRGDLARLPRQAP
jgi:retinol-binding protein 3